MITLQFPGMRPQAKRNSQFRNGHSYVEPHYRQWRSMFGMAARGQWLVMALGAGGLRIEQREPLTCDLFVSVTFATVSGGLRGDLDNAFAAVADGLMDGDVIADDKQIKRLAAQVVKAKKADCGITVTIEAMP